MSRFSIPDLLLPIALCVALLGPLADHASAQQPAAPADTLEVDTLGVSGRGAFLRSLVLPGWGQSYVGSPGRGAIYFALEAGSLWWTYKTGRALSDARELERWYIRTLDLPESAGEWPEEARSARGLVESRREQMEDRIFQSFFIALFAAADAYVAAHLADFEEHIGVRPTPGGGMQFEARIPLGSRP